MALTRPTIQTIYTRIVGNLESRLLAATPGITQVKIQRASLLGILAMVLAGIEYSIIGLIVFLSRQILPDTAEDEWLDRHLGLKGMARLPATYANGACTFTGTNGQVIVTGTRVTTVTGLIYETDEDVEITAGTATVDVTCITAGTAGNTTLSEVTLVSPLAGVDSAATLSTLPVGGTDAETYEYARQRLLDKLAEPPAGGRAYDYETWAKEVAGVTRAWAFDAYNGAGTVGVIVANGNAAVAQEILDDVAAYIEDGRKVLGTQLYVNTIIPVVYDFTINLPNTEGHLQDEVTYNLTQLFNDESEPAGTILISHIQNAILSATVSDYEIEAIYKDDVSIPVGNLTNTGLELPTIGTITFGVL